MNDGLMQPRDVRENWGRCPYTGCLFSTPHADAYINHLRDTHNCTPGDYDEVDRGMAVVAEDDARFCGFKRAELESMLGISLLDWQWVVLRNVQDRAP